MHSTPVAPGPESLSTIATDIKWPRLSHVWDRERCDHYIEPVWCSARLFEVEDFDRNQILLDACCGFGRIAASAKAAGYTNVIAADIVDRGYPGCEIQDFLQRQSVPPTVVCNPPFNMVEAFARHALTLGACQLAADLPRRALERRSLVEGLAAAADLAADATAIDAARLCHRARRKARRGKNRLCVAGF